MVCRLSPGAKWIRTPGLFLASAFELIVTQSDCGETLSVLRRHGRRTQVIDRVIEGDSNGVYLAHQKLVGHGKEFHA
jgi:hypothetical protein